MILLVLSENENSMGNRAIKKEVGKLKGLAYESKSFQSSFSRSVLDLEKKRFVDVNVYEFRRGKGHWIPSHTIRPTSHGLEVAKKEKAKKKLIVEKPNEESDNSQTAQ